VPLRVRWNVWETGHVQDPFDAVRQQTASANRFNELKKQ
jgi:hypothetical protein